MSFTQPVLEGIARISARRPHLALFSSLLCCLLLGTPILWLRLDPDPVNMLPKDAGPLQRMNELVTVFGSGDQLFLAFDWKDHHVPTDDDVTAIRAVIESLADEIEDWQWTNPATGAEEPMMGLVVGRSDAAMETALRDLVGSTGFLALPDDPALIERLQSRLNPKRLARNFAKGPPADVPAPLHSRDLLGLWTDFYRPHLTMLADGNMPLRNDGGYLCTPDRSCHVLMLNPTLPIKNMLFTQAIAERLATLEAAFPQRPDTGELSLQVAGGYLLANDDFQAVRESAIITLITSIVGIVVLFGCVYRSLRLVAFIGTAVLPAILAAMGIATLAFGGTLSLMVSAFSAVLVGLGVDYVIHVFNAYSWSLKHQTDKHPDDRSRRRAAAIQAVHRVGPGILLGCITSVASFAILGLSDFRGLRELGLVTACGLGCILLLMLVVTPALLTLWGPNSCREPTFLVRYTALFGRRPRRFVVISIALAIFVIASLTLAPTLLVFDKDLRNLRPKASIATTQAYVELGHRLGIDFAGLEMLFRSHDLETMLDEVATYYRDLEPLRQPLPITIDGELHRRDLEHGPVPRLAATYTGSAESLAGRHIIMSPWGRLHFDRYEDGALHQLSLVDSHGDDQTTDLIPAGSTTEIAPILRHDGPSGSQLQALPAPSHQRTMLTALQEVDWDALLAVIDSQDEQTQQRYAPFIADIRAMAQRIDDQRLLLPDDLDGTPIGQLIEQVLASSDDGIWYMRLPVPLAHDRRHVPFTELQHVLGFDSGPDGEGDSDNTIELHQHVTASLIGGTALEFYIQKLVIGNFTRLTLVAAGVTVLILLIAMRNLATVAITLGTLGSGVALMLACMHVFDLKWTILNICVLPLILGIGIDNAIHFLHHLAKQDRSHNGLMRTLLEIGYPIYMTALTSIVGFGSLLMNAYQGVQDLGILASIGISACLVTTILVLPTILIWTHYKPPPDPEQDPRSRIMPSIKMTRPGED